MNAKPIKDLWFRYVKDTDLEEMNAQGVALALLNAGLIELVPHRSKPTFEHYVDSPKLKTIRKEERAREIARILLNHHKGGRE